MFKHYIASALRHYARHKTTTIINVLCLSFGLTCFAAVYGLTQYYGHSDLYHEKADRTYVVTQRNALPDQVGVISTMPLTGLSVGQYLKQDYASLEIARATVGQEMAVALQNSAQNTKDFALVSYADPEFLSIFDLNFIAGNRRAALKDHRSAVINEDFARKLFGSADVLGKTLLLNNRETVQITGVIGPQPQPSHITSAGVMPFLKFSLLVSMDTQDAILAASDPEAARLASRIFQQSTLTYIAFPEGAIQTPVQVRNELTRFADRHMPPEEGRVELGLRPAAEIYEVLGDFTYQRDRTGISNQLMTLILGSLVLVAACLNYANLASAQATTRLKELALRRVVGASHSQILVQSFVEAFLLVLVAGCVTLALLPGVIGALQMSMGLDIGPLLFSSAQFWIWLVATLTAVAIVSCSYPAWVAARIRPAQALHSGRVPLTKRRIMRTLVVCQFAMASFLFIAASVMNAQIQKIRPAARGITNDPVIVIGNNLRDAGVDIQLLQNELRRQPAIQSVTALDVAPGIGANPRGIVMNNTEASSRRWIISTRAVDHDFFATMEIRLLAGRGFDRSNASDVATGPGIGNAVIDRALAAEFGWTNPQDAIGKHIYVPSSLLQNAVGVPRIVIGVVENEMLAPVAFVGSASTLYSLAPQRVSALLIRVAKDNVAGGISAIDSTWNQLAPNIPLKRKFWDEQFDVIFKSLVGMTTIFPALALIAMLVGTMGLVGIATHAMAQRRYEIGVRRTLGASTRRILMMLLIDFGKPVMIANLIAWPFAFVLAKVISSFFADKAQLTIVPFASTLLLGLVIAWLAVLKQASSAARTNPATVLRHE